MTAFVFSLRFQFIWVTQDVVEGAQTSIHVAVSSEVSDISGEYFADCEVNSGKSAGMRQFCVYTF